MILETVAVDRLQEEKVIARFQADRDEAYRKFIDKCGDFDAEITRNGQRTTSPTPSLRIMTSI
ncbi:DnaJ-domain-containing protein 1 [Rhizobium mesoamericanum]|nr:DnaJ-domain-containing protein 1 [Rhizobium mesoamericanum]